MTCFPFVLLKDRCCVCVCVGVWQSLHYALSCLNRVTFRGALNELREMMLLAYKT